MLRLLVQMAVAAWRRPDPDQAPIAPAEPAVKAAPLSDIDTLEAHLAGLAGDNAAVLSGALQHLGLDEIRDALGDAWPGLAPQLLSFAATRLQLWTGLRDEVRRHGASGFVIRFADLPRPAAEQQAKRLTLRLKAELLEDFPQVAGGKPPRAATGPAHEIMARRLEASEQYRQSVQRHDGTDPRLWRSALGQAVLELLEADGEVSAEALIAQLQMQSQEADELVLRAASIDAAIERLRSLVARMAAAKAGEAAPCTDSNAA